MERQFGTYRKGRLKYLLTSVLILSAAFLAMGRPVLAADEDTLPDVSLPAREGMDSRVPEEYSYTVRLYAGNQGRLTEKGVEVKSDTARIDADQNQMVITGLRYGDLVSIRPQEAALSTDERYYVKGVRRSGRDNSEAEAPAFYVGSDRDFVVAYGVSGETAAYTVTYVDEDGKQIMESDTYYGNIGERQYVSSRYIDGYQPQALNMVQTLSANEAENVFTFTYAPVQSAASAPSVGPAAPGSGPAEGAEEPSGSEDPDGEASLGGDANAGPEDYADGSLEEPGRQIDEESVPLASGQEFLKDKDIEDEKVPLGLYRDERRNTILGYLPIYIGIGTASLMALAVAALLLKRREMAHAKAFGRGDGRLAGYRK